MTRLLIATPEPIGVRSSGRANRAAQMARVIGAHHEVVLASAAGPSISPVGNRAVVALDDVAAGDVDAAVLQGRTSVDRPDLLRSNLPLAFDWFDPFHLDALHRGGDRARRHDLVAEARETLLGQARRGDFFLCSNQSQRDHWLGLLAAVGRVNHLTHGADATLRRLIDVAPFGVANEPFEPTAPARSTFPGIGPDDPILLWVGGLHDWLDPVLVVEAMPRILTASPDARLVFLAGPHPNTSLETMGVRGRAIGRARELRLYGRRVLFVNRWIDYADRLPWLAEATVGVVAHHDDIESHYSHRTRLFDHLAAGLPTVSSAGDPAGRLLRGSGAALTVPPGDVVAFADAVVDVLTDPDVRESLRSAALTLGAAMRWEQTLAPLLRWVDDPAPAPDRRPAAPAPTDADAGPIARLLGASPVRFGRERVRRLADRARRAGRWRVRSSGRPPS